jgi:hypothetical protein
VPCCLACPAAAQRAVKLYDLEANLRTVDQEVRALQRVTSSGCRYVVGLEGIALLTRDWGLTRDERLGVGLVFQNLFETLKERYRGGIRARFEFVLRPLLFQLLLGVYELHYHGIWHGLLGPEHVMAAEPTSSTPHVTFTEQMVIIGLGGSKMVEELHTYGPTSIRTCMVLRPLNMSRSLRR